jgi:hypothetical protein
MLSRNFDFRPYCSMIRSISLKVLNGIPVNCKEVVYLELSSSTLWSLLCLVLLLTVNLIFLIPIWETFSSK